MNNTQDSKQPTRPALAPVTGYAACFVAGLSVANLPSVISGERPLNAYIVFLFLAWLPVAVIALWRHNESSSATAK